MCFVGDTGALVRREHGDDVPVEGRAAGSVVVEERERGVLRGVALVVMQRTLPPCHVMKMWQGCGRKWGRCI